LSIWILSSVDDEQARDLERTARLGEKRAADGLERLHREEAGPDLLGDPARLAGLDPCPPYLVEQRGVVDYQSVSEEVMVFLNCEVIDVALFLNSPQSRHLDARVGVDGLEQRPAVRRGHYQRRVPDHVPADPFARVKGTVLKTIAPDDLVAPTKLLEEDFGDWGDVEDAVGLGSSHVDSRGQHLLLLPESNILDEGREVFLAANEYLPATALLPEIG